MDVVCCSFRGHSEFLSALATSNSLPHNLEVAMSLCVQRPCMRGFAAVLLQSANNRGVAFVNIAFSYSYFSSSIFIVAR